MWRREERQWPREVMERVNGGATITWWRGTRRRLGVGAASPACFALGGAKGSPRFVLGEGAR